VKAINYSLSLLHIKTRDDFEVNIIKLKISGAEFLQYTKIFKLPTATYEGIPIEMKTVLHVIDTTGPGGAETIFLQLAQKVAENGHKSIALIRGSGWVQSQLEQLNIPFYVIDCKGSFNLKYLLSLVKLIRAEKVDIIQSHLLGSSVYCSMAGIITKTRVISTFHGIVDISPNERFRKIKLLALRLGSSKIVAVTDILYKMICDLGTIPSSKITTICNGIDISLYKKIATQEYRDKLNINKGDILIGSLGNIRTQKLSAGN